MLFLRLNNEGTSSRGARQEQVLEQVFTCSTKQVSYTSGEEKEKFSQTPDLDVDSKWQRCSTSDVHSRAFA